MKILGTIKDVCFNYMDFEVEDMNITDEGLSLCITNHTEQVFIELEVREIVRLVSYILREMISNIW